MSRNPRRAYDRDGREIEPMPLANMREHGVRSVEATCEDCKHEAIMDRAKGRRPRSFLGAGGLVTSRRTCRVARVFR